MAAGGYYPAWEDSGEDVEVALVWGRTKGKSGAEEKHGKRKRHMGYAWCGLE